MAVRCRASDVPTFPFTCFAFLRVLRGCTLFAGAGTAVSRVAAVADEGSFAFVVVSLVPFEISSAIFQISFVIAVVSFVSVEISSVMNQGSFVISVVSFAANEVSSIVFQISFVANETTEIAHQRRTLPGETSSNTARTAEPLCMDSRSIRVSAA